MNEFNTSNDIMPNTWKPANSIIKVLGVGGGGCNAVNYMYNQHIEGCTFIVCNNRLKRYKAKRNPQQRQALTGEFHHHFSCGGPTRTGDLQVMSLASYQLLHPAILYRQTRSN